MMIRLAATGVMASMVLTVSVLTVSVLGSSCAAPPGGVAAVSDGGDGQPAKKAAPLPIATERVLRALEADNAALRRQIAEGPRPDAYQGIINAHEHAASLKDLERYLPAARTAGIAATVLVASPEFTIMGKGDKGEPSMSQNFKALLEAQRAYPDEIIPFATIDPKDPQKLEHLQEHVAMGARGLKIYSGHSNFYDGPLLPKDMEPVLQYLEQTGLPVNWHINLAKFMDDFEAVMAKFPKLNVMVPHFGVVFWRANGPAMARLTALLQKYPGIYVDTSLGTREILLDGMAAIEPHREAFRAFFEAHQNQILWGTDSVITGNAEKTPGWYHKVIWATRDHLEKDVFSTELAAGYSRYFQKGRDGEGRFQGLALPPAILQKVYVDNTRRWLRLP